MKRMSKTVFILLHAVFAAFVVVSSASLGADANDSTAAVEVPPGYVLIEGDMIVPVEVLEAGSNGLGVQGTYQPMLWPGGIVPYEFDANVSESNRQAALGAMAEWGAVAGVGFIPRSNETGFIHIYDSDMNAAVVGYTGSEQGVWIYNWTYRFIVAHELGHTLGLWHEQSRSDRDTYITVNFANVEAGEEHNFEIRANAPVVGPYDFDSVMHYGQCDFSTCAICFSDLANCRTITVNAPWYAEWQNRIGQYDHLSQGDIQTMLTMYPLLPSRIEVTGPSTVNENSSGNYTCTAFYEDGSSQVVTSSASWSEDSEYATIDASGRLTTLAVPSDQPCRITASYSGKTAYKDVTITNEPPPSGTWYVRCGASGNGTPENPFGAIQDAVDAASSGDTINVAACTYVENILIEDKSLTIQGGWDSTFSERDWEAHVAIIDGGGTDRCVLYRSCPAGELSGFTITNGLATSASAHGPHGGGILFRQSSPAVSHNKITSNTAGHMGGGIASESGSSLTVRSTVISGNNVTDPGGGGGAGTYCSQASLTLINCTVVGNRSEWGAGAYLSNSASVEAVNCIFWDNEASNCSEFYVSGSASLTADCSNVEGGQPSPEFECVTTDSPVNWGAGNISVDPQFADLGHWDGDTWVDGDYHLKSRGGRYDPSRGLPPDDPDAWVIDDVHSPCIDAGDASDYSNEPEPSGGRVNMGAYGNTAEASKSYVVPLELCFIKNEGPFTTSTGALVTLSNYWIGKYEVTNAQYCEFLNAGGNDDHWHSEMAGEIARAGETPPYLYSVAQGLENRPVRWVTWYDAVAFCDWLSVAEGLPAGTYHLPTEAQWEKAAGWDSDAQRLHTYTVCGDSIDCSKANFDACVGHTTDVRTYYPWASCYGCYDMSGNVWEWCSDWYGSTYPSSTSNPAGPTTGSQRMLRGGSFSNDATDCRVDSRAGYHAPSGGNYNFGFRVVRTPLPLEIICPDDLTLECPAGPVETHPDNTGYPNTTGGCSEPTIRWDDNVMPRCGQTKTITRTWTATDECGNSATCVQIIKVVDTTPPVIECPPDIVLECPVDCTTPECTGTATATDACGEVTITYADDVVPGCGATKTITRTWTATDECGNSATCNQIITVVDTTPPIIQCPPDVVLECPADCTTPDCTGTATATDTCGNVTIGYEDSFSPGCGGTGTILRTWTATDECGNSASCVQVIEIVDDIPVGISCPPEIERECPACTTPDCTGEPTVIDPCGAATVTYTDTVYPDCCGAKTIIRRWKVTDECGKSASCTQIIWVADTTPPEIVCPPDVVLECPADTTPDNTGYATAIDACCADAVTITYVDEVVPGCCGTETIIRTWTTTDDCGNSASCVQTITVRDTTPPDMSCPPDILLECPADTDPGITGSATAWDACCGEVTPTYDDVITPGCCDAKTIIRTWTATDDCGNSASCVQTITVQDTTPPEITCPPDVVLECPADTGPISTGSATAWDACCGEVMPTYDDVITPGCGSTMTILRTWTATDDCGNSSSCVQRIEVIDTTPPEITCPADVTLECPADCTTPECTGYPTATDGCGDVTIAYVDDVVPGCGATKTITRTWTATDECRNSASCDQTIKVVDTTAPQCDANPDDIDDLTVPEGTAVTLTYSVTDNCDPDPECCWYEGDQLLGCGSPLILTFDLGEHMVTLRCTDDCGNTCEDTLTVKVYSWILSIESFPIAGVSITGDKPGTTNYAERCLHGEVVNLLAPATASINGRCYNFMYWLVDGEIKAKGVPSMQVTMDNNRTAIAVYDPWPVGDLDGNCRVNVLDLIRVRNNLNKTCTSSCAQ